MGSRSKALSQKVLWKCIKYIMLWILAPFASSATNKLMKFLWVFRSRGYSWEFWVGVCRPVLQILTLFQTKNYHFHTRFQAWPLAKIHITVFRPGVGRKYVIITTVITKIRKPTRSHVEFAYYSFFLNHCLHLELKWQILILSKTIPGFRPK